MKPDELLTMLREFYRARSAMRNRHAASAGFVFDYDINNTYQYILNREDVHLRWLFDAIAELGGAAEDAPPAQLQVQGKKDEAQNTVLREDRDQAQAFVDSWRDRVEKVTHARNRTMLRVILGEILEQKRFFAQGLAGRKDLLGRRADGAGTDGVVLPTRWVGQP